MKVVELMEIRGAMRFSDRFRKFRPKGTSNKLNILNKGDGVKCYCLLE